jgi:hypothetical protein
MRTASFFIHQFLAMLFIMLNILFAQNPSLQTLYVSQACLVLPRTSPENPEAFGSAPTS